MKKAILFLVSLILLTALTEWIILLQIHMDRWRLAAFLASLSLVLTAFVSLTDPRVVRQLRQWALESLGAALGVPFLLLIPYSIFAFGTGTFSVQAILKLATYIAVPTILLLPDRFHRADRVGWRDLTAMVALALPVSARWLEGIWRWPQELYFFRPLFCVCVGAYSFLVIRNLEGVGYRLMFRKGDVIDGLSNFAAFALIAIPLGLFMGFIHFHPHPVGAPEFLFQFFGIYLTVAIPEELLFRGILQNFLVKSIPLASRSLYGLLIASVVFGASHLHHPPVPNWKYGILATVAGIFYGNTYRTRRRLSASALSHTLVDTTWHLWF